MNVLGFQQRHTRILPARNAPIDNPQKTMIHFQVEMVLLSDTNGTCRSLNCLPCCRSCSLEPFSSGTYFSNGKIEFGLGKVITEGGDSIRPRKDSVDSDEDLLDSSNTPLDSLRCVPLKSMMYMIDDYCFTTITKMKGT